MCCPLLLTGNVSKMFFLRLFRRSPRVEPLVTILGPLFSLAVCVCGGEEGYVEFRRQCQVSSSGMSSVSFVTGLLTGLEFTIRLGWLANKPQGSACLYLPRAGITRVYHQPWLFTWVLQIVLSSSHLQSKHLID